MFTHLETSGNRSRQTKDDTRRIGDYERPVALLFEKPVSNPHRAVDECDERLNPVSLMTGQISDDLRDIGNVHTDGQTGGNHADDAHLFFGSLFAKLYSLLFQMLYLSFCFLILLPYCVPSKKINDLSTPDIVTQNFLTDTTFPSVYRYTQCSLEQFPLGDTP